MVVSLSCVLTIGAQSYTEHLQTREEGQGRIKVVESLSIDSLVNGKINMGIEPRAVKETAKTSLPRMKLVTDKEEGEDDATTVTTTVDTNKKVVKNAVKTTGYRVQVFAGSNSRADKTKAESVGNQIKHLFPDQPVYVHFYSPRWICRMGNFRTYEEATEMLHQVKAAGFKQASLVKGTITLTD